MDDDVAVVNATNTHTAYLIRKYKWVKFVISFLFKNAISVSQQYGNMAAGETH